MIEFAGRGIVLDIEGTTSSVRFVYEILFPFARQRLSEFLERRWLDPAVVAACRLLGSVPLDRAAVIAELNRLMDGDVKSTALKAIQGLIWEEGYAAGQLCSHVYPDVPIALKRWRDLGIDVRIYSSGSIEAQKSFFGRTEFGDLRPFLLGHYDTTTGPKREASSYQHIVQNMSLPASETLFLSDIPAELDAASAAGLQTGLVIRPGNSPVDETYPHPRIFSFDEILCRGSFGAD